MFFKYAHSALETFGFLIGIHYFQCLYIEKDTTVVALSRMWEISTDLSR